MEYQVTARKWRPQTFGEVIGQKHVTRALMNAIASNKIPHAYLFSGPRGVGKTTTARLLAKALNCKSGPTSQPCNQCQNCLEIMNGSSLDVREVDGASNRGIDDIREIRDNVTYMPLSGRYKIYIIDEVHMLTKEASNALLKTLEEPPAHVIFMLATTEPQKILPTIRSRCQHYVFKKISISVISAHLKNICEKDNIKYNDEGLYYIAKAGDGSMRDAQSIFDQVVLYSDGNITEESAIEVLGIPDESFFENIIVSITNQDPVKMLETVNDYLNKNGDIKLFSGNLIEYFRIGLLTKKLKAGHELVDLSKKRYDNLKELFSGFSSKDIVKIMNILIDMFRQLRNENQERFLLETTLFKVLDYRNIIPLSELRDELIRLSDTGIQPVRKPSVQAPENNQIKPPVRKVVQENNDNEQVYRKLEVDTKKKNNDTVSHNGSMNFNEALKRTLSKSRLMSSMMNDIKKINLDGNHAVVEIIKASSCELLTSSGNNIEKSINELTGILYNVEFTCEDISDNNTKPREATVQNRTVNNAEKKAPSLNIKNYAEKQPDNKSKNLEKTEKKEENKNNGEHDETVNYVNGLFDGKIT